MNRGPIKTIAAKISAIDEPTPGVKRIVLNDEDWWPLPPFLPGAHIDLHLNPGLVRTYSICNEPTDNKRYVIAVKREVAGRGGSNFIHSELRAGMTVGVSLPRGGIQMARCAMNVFIAGGIGVTPFISAIRELELHGQSNYVLHWVSSGAPSLIDMLSSGVAAGRVRLYDTTHQPVPDIAGILAGSSSDCKAYCCGPAGMLDHFEAIVGGWPDARKHIERFTSSVPVLYSSAEAYTVVLAKSKRSMLVQPNIGLLKALEALDADVSASCEQGICGACRTRWLEGPPVHNDRVLSREERETEVMVCVAGCAGARLVLDL